MYMNDNNGVFPGQQRCRGCRSCEHESKIPLDLEESSNHRLITRSSSEPGDGTTAVSYGINANMLPGNVAISADKITKPVDIHSICARASIGYNGDLPRYSSFAAPGVTVSGMQFGGKHPGGTPWAEQPTTAQKSTRSSADWHAETMAWSGTGPAFTNITE